MKKVKQIAVNYYYCTVLACSITRTTKLLASNHQARRTSSN